MNRQEFLELLRKGLYGLPQEDIEERIAFYAEMIDDRIEEGLSETEAIAAVGSVEEIVFQTVSEIPFAKIAKERIKTKRLKAWETVLLVLGSPIWLSLSIAAVAVILALYVSFWSVIISLWAVFVSFAACALGCVFGGAVLIFKGDIYAGIAVISAGIICAGFGIFMFYGCKLASKGVLILTKKIAVCIKNCFIKKEEA